MAALSRNDQENFLTPLLDRDEVALALQSGALEHLLARLRVHTLDRLLSNRRVHRSADEPRRCCCIAQQPVSLVGQPARRQRRFRFPDDRAEVDVMALLRLLAHNAGGIALLPRVVVRDELRSGALVEQALVPDLFENV